MDHRLLNLSYSSNKLLHECPRRFQLYKLNGQEIDRDGEVVRKQNVTFAFGTVVGEGAQEILRSGDTNKAIWKMFQMWEPDLFDRNDKQVKSFWHAVFAVQKFAAIQKMILAGYELVYWEGKPATELSFVIDLPNGFRYRGFVDAVLRHKETGKVIVLELKTSSANAVEPATFGNSAQAIGYSIVLDVLFPEINSYEVLYMVYLTKQMDFADPMKFTKSYLMRALWIQELLLDMDIIGLYEARGVYPMHGESCYSWYRVCEYYGICTISTDKITKPEPELEDRKVEQFQINLTLNDLIQAQISKSQMKPQSQINNLLENTNV